MGLTRLVRLFKAQKSQPKKSSIHETLDAFDLSHPLSESQRAEAQKHRRLFQLRDWLPPQKQPKTGLVNRLLRLVRYPGYD